MTVSTENPRISYVYTGPDTYAYPFRVNKDEDLEVVYTDIAGLTTVLLLGIDYTATVNVLPLIGGDITTSFVPTDGFLSIQRSIIIDQEVDFVNNDPFDMEITEGAFDKLTMIVQQLELIVDQGAAVLGWRGDWANNVAYTSGDVVVKTSNGNLYIATSTHTSNAAGTIDDDIALGLWQLLVDLQSVQDLVDDAETAANTAVDAANTASSAAVAAGNSESLASTHKDDAEAAATAAAGSAGAAGTSEGNAFLSETAAAASAGQASTFASNASNFADIAEDWSSELEDVEIPSAPGFFSAFHWAQKSAQSASVSMITTNTTINVPADFADPALAMDSLNNVIFARDVLVTIQVADGTYTGLPTINGHPQGMQIEILGNIVTPTNCVLEFAQDIDGFKVDRKSNIKLIDGFHITQDSASTVVSIAAFVSSEGSYVKVGANNVVDFAFSGRQLWATSDSFLRANGSTIIGNNSAIQAVLAVSNSLVTLNSTAITGGTGQTAVYIGDGSQAFMNSATVTGGVGVTCTLQSRLYANTLSIINSSTIGLTVSDNSRFQGVTLVISQTTEDGTTGLSVTAGSAGIAVGVVVSGSSRTGPCINANNGSILSISGCITSNGTYGIYAQDEVQVTANSCDISDASVNGIFGIRSCAISATSGSIVDSGSHNVSINDGSSIHNAGGTCTGSVAGYGYAIASMSYCSIGSTTTGNFSGVSTPASGADGNNNSRVV